MNVDEISKACKKDSLILKFGERKYLKRDIEEHTATSVSSRMRELGRLVLALKEKSSGEISNLQKALHISNFDILLSCKKIYHCDGLVLSYTYNLNI